ncbi:choice-of-anchor V domain-containing protein [Neolewinella litorea]|uniref:Reelin domain-containing protein n=1 Tax=Neolewinella litorea TaxID=2562452 RepID=A0A4S4NAD1_9BACT|nr:choice-of-anchor V domain-containing protein [Neolewinella litorea]THH35008.1 hypothetical protein E4021_16970 [Neolewinella litorea]
MKPRTLSLFPLLAAAAALLLTAYSSGVASAIERGYTGAPNLSGGTEPTCSNCHNTGDYGEPRLGVSFDGVQMTDYRPGQTYRVTVAVRPGQGEPAAYGFQAQFLAGATPVPAGELGAPDDQTQIATLSDGRVYVEHRLPNPDSLFSFDWTAPEQGAGPVSFYLVGNTVNLNVDLTGDNGSAKPFILTLEESQTTAVTAAGANKVTQLRAFPNPTHGRSTVLFDLPAAGWVQGKLLSAAGQVLASQTGFHPAGNNEWPVDLSFQPPGVYRLHLSSSRGEMIAVVVRQ